MRGRGLLKLVNCEFRYVIKRRTRRSKGPSPTGRMHVRNEIVTWENWWMAINFVFVRPSRIGWGARAAYLSVYVRRINFSALGRLLQFISSVANRSASQAKVVVVFFLNFVSSVKSLHCIVKPNAAPQWLLLMNDIYKRKHVDTDTVNVNIIILKIKRKLRRRER